MIADNKYKEVAEEYGTCVKYGISIKDNVGTIMPLVNMEIQNLLKKQI